MHFTALPLCNPAAEEIPSERGLETKTPAPPFEALVPLIGDQSPMISMAY